MKNLLAKACLVIPLLLSHTPALAQNTSAIVVSIGDGDTLRIRQSGQVKTIRLGCIDSPETSQNPWGQQSTTRLKQLLPLNTPVQVRVITRDRYGRTVAELYVGKQSINLQMVKDGQAVVYRQYLEGCAATKNQYLQAEAQAKKQRIGFWNQKFPVMPWDYRRGKRSSTPRQPTKVALSVQQIQSLPSCTKNDCNCSDFVIQAQAQQVLTAFPGDKFRLDGDSDGVACHS